MAPKMFITFEGIDGSGKTTQIEMLKQKMSGLNIANCFVHDPGSTEIGEKIRNILLSPESREMSLTAEVLLYAAARAQLISQVIEPALAAGKVVVCDRFIHSSLAYQGFGLGYDLDNIILINKEAMGKIWPDLVFIMDIEVKESLSRCTYKSRNGQEKDRIEQRSSEFYHRVRRGYLTLAEEDKNRIVVIPSRLSIDESHRKIWGAINERVDFGL